MKIIDNLRFLCYIPVISGFLFQVLSCKQASEFPQAYQLLDSLQNQKKR